MYKDVLRSMEGVELFPSISLILFFAFFVLLVVWLVKHGKHHWDEAANLPLEATDNHEFLTKES